MHRGRSGPTLGRRIDAIRKRMQRGTIKTVFQYGTRYVLLDESDTRHTTDLDSGRDARSSSPISRLKDEITFLWREPWRKGA